MAAVSIKGACPDCGQEFKMEWELGEEKAGNIEDGVFKAFAPETTFVLCENPKCQKLFVVELPKRS